MKKLLSLALVLVMLLTQFAFTSFADIGGIGDAIVSSNACSFR